MKSDAPSRPPLPLLMAMFFALFCFYFDVFRWLIQTWAQGQDYSHGFVVPIFSAYLLWTNRSVLRNPDWEVNRSGIWIGLACMCFGLLLRLSGIYTRTLMLEGLSLIPFAIGAMGIALGSRGIRWCTPAALFLVFMVPLPGFLSGRLSGLLQTIATEVSTFSLQTIGIPALAEGNVISLTNGQIGVAEACSGLQMLYAFFSLTVGACLIIDRTWIERLLIAVSAIPIAMMANCIRIFATGLVFEYWDPTTAEYVFHDVAGWLMMPLGFLILMVGLGFLDRLIIVEETMPPALR